MPAYNGNDFYCDEVLSGRTAVQRVMETDNVLALHHTRASVRRTANESYNGVIVRRSSSE